MQSSSSSNPDRRMNDINVVSISVNQNLQALSRCGDVYTHPCHCFFQGASSSAQAETRRKRRNNFCDQCGGAHKPGKPCRQQPKSKRTRTVSGDNPLEVGAPQGFALVTPADGPLLDDEDIDPGPFLQPAEVAFPEFDPRLLLDEAVEDDSEEEDEETPQNGSSSAAAPRGSKKKKVNNPWPEYNIKLNKLLKVGLHNGQYAFWHPAYKGAKRGPRNIDITQTKIELDFVRLLMTDQVVAIEVSG